MVEKRREKNKVQYIIACFLLLIAIVYLGFNILDAWHKYQEGKKRLESSTSSYIELSKQYSDLQKRKALEESSTGYEMHVRSKFDMNKLNENVIFIVDEESPEIPPEEKGIKKVMDTFKNFFN